MQVTLQVSNGPLAGRIIFLKAGQRAEIGRTEWADFTFPRDSEMADVHFAVECLPDGFWLRDMHTASGTRVDGQPIQEIRLSHGMEILAGQTRFQVMLDPPDQPGRDATARTHPAGKTNAPQGPAGGDHQPLAADYCQVLELDEESQAILDENPGLLPDQFFALLMERELFVDAIRFKAQTLPKRQAIRWTLDCMRMFPDTSAKKEQNRFALSAVDAWLSDPTEANRRNAESAAASLNYETPAAWAAMTVFWSEGSLAPPEIEAVSPANHLTGVAASAALLMSAASGPAVDVSARQREFLSLSAQLTTQP